MNAVMQPDEPAESVRSRFERTLQRITGWIIAHPRIFWPFVALLASTSSWVTVWMAGFRDWIALLIIVVGTALTMLAAIFVGPFLINSYRDESNRQSSGSTTERRVFFAAALLLICAGATFGPLDNFVGNLHQPGAAKFGATVATRPSLIPSPTDVRLRTTDAVRTWWAFTRPCNTTNPPPNCGKTDVTASSDNADIPTTSPKSPFPDYPDAPIRVSGLLFTLDGFLLLPGYVMLLLLLFIWGRRYIREQSQNIEETGSERLPERLMSVSSWATATVLAAALADLIENALSMWILRSAWHGYDSADPDKIAVSSGWFWVLSALTWFKVAALGLGIIWVAWFVWTALRHAGNRDQQWTQSSGLWRTIVILRVPVVIACGLAIGVLLPSQTSELFWRWSDTSGHAIAAVILTILLSGGIYFISQWQIVRAWIYASPVGVGWPQRPSKIDRRFWKWFIAVASTLLLIPSILDHTTKPLIGVGLVLGIALLGIPLGSGSNSHDPRRPGLGRGTLPFILAASVPILMAVGALRAASEMLPYQLLRGVETTRWYVLPAATLIFIILAAAYSYLWSQRFGLLRFRRPLLILEAGLLQRYPNISRRLPKFFLEFEARSYGWRQPLILISLTLTAWLAVIWVISAENRLHGWTAQIGPAAIILLFLLLVASFLSALIELVDWFTPHAPRVLALVSFRRMPVILFLALWLIIASIRPPGPKEDLYDVQLASTEALAQDSGIKRDEIALHQAESLEAAFNMWRWENCLVASSASEETSGLEDVQKPVVPLILIATSGGGVRAATWTSYVMDRAIGYQPDGVQTCASSPVSDAPPSQRVFAASGISGGSAGLATWTIRQQQASPDRDPSTCPEDVNDSKSASFSDCPPQDESRGEGWIEHELSKDFLSPQLSWFLFAEAPWSFIRVGLDQSRADVLDDGWERTWGVSEDPPNLFQLRERELDWEIEWQRRAADGLDSSDIDALYRLLQEQDQIAAQHDQPVQRVPLLVFNGTSAESGCRFNSSVLSGNARPVSDPTAACLQPEALEQSADTVLPATNDLADYLCPNQDIRLSTASLLSARFPVLSPAGHLKECDDAEGASSETWIIDGGYLEAAGAVTIADLWSALEPLIEQHNRDPLAAAYIVPVMIQIDNGHIEPAGPNQTTAPPQFLAPIKGVVGSRNGNNSLNRQSTQAIFSKPYIVTYDAEGAPITWCGDRYANFSLLAHPGPQARLGWILSDVGFSDLQNQFRGNPTPVRIVDEWRGDLSPLLSLNQDRGHCPAPDSTN